MSKYDEALKQLDEYILKPADYTMFPWSKFGQTLQWCDTSSDAMCIYQAHTPLDGNWSNDYVVFTIEEDCGAYYQAIFSKRQKMSSDDFHERYGDNY